MPEIDARKIDDPLGLLGRDVTSVDISADQYRTALQLTPEELPPPRREFVIKTGKITEPSKIRQLYDRFFGMTPSEERAQAQVEYFMSQETGLPISVVHDNYREIINQMDIAETPDYRRSVEDLLTAGLAGGVTIGLLTSGVGATIAGTVGGLAIFGTLAEGENYLASKLANKPYRFGKGRGFADLLPEETEEGFKDLVWTADMAWKAIATGGALKLAKPQVNRFVTKFTRDMIEKYNLPRTVFFSPEKLRAYHGIDPEAQLTPEEINILRTVDISADQYRTGLKEGIDIELPSEKIIHCVDKPWWAAVKRFFRASPYDEVVTEAVAGRAKRPVAGLLTEGKAGEAGEPVSPEAKVAEAGKVVSPEAKVAEADKPYLAAPTEEKVAKPEATITKEEMPKELKVLAESIKNYKNVAEFRKAYTQSHLMDLSNPEMHRWGRALAPYKDAPHVDIPQIISDGKYPGSYLTTIKYEYPQIYRSIVSPSDKITVYRAVPEDKAGEGIQIGDYVALDREYAQMHLTSVLEGEQGIKGKIISNSVPKSDIIWGNADFREWVYSPKKIRDYAGSLEEFYETVNSQTAAKGVKPEETIPIELEPLAKEARKHKSAEEFGKAVIKLDGKENPQIIDFNGLKLLTTDSILGGGNFKNLHIFTEDGWKFVESKRGLGKFSKTDLTRIVENHKDKIISLTDFYNQAVKAGKTVPPKAKPIEPERYAVEEPVWHGTPYYLPEEPGFPHGRFRLDKIGTGEGAQAYGWGIYFAKNPGVAKSYYISLALPEIDGISFNHLDYSPLLEAGYNWNEADVLNKIAFDYHGNYTAYIDDLRNTLNNYKDMGYGHNIYASIQRSIEIAERLGPKIKRGGALYHLDLPDEVLPQLLDWDKPLSEQSEYVRTKNERALTENIKQPSRFFDDLLLAGPSKKGGVEYHADGRRIYDAFSRLKGSAKAASEYLASIGIPGLKYFDQPSRKKGEGTHNYVIWDQDVLDRIVLLERNNERLQTIREGQQAYNLKGELENDFETYSDNLSTASGEVVRPGGREGAGISTLGKAITDELVAKGRIDLRGKTVKTADELATVAQVFRDPRVETARFFYVDDNGKILAHEGISSRMPNSSEVFVTDRARAVQDMKERMERLGATGYWMLHNHPTGQPFPSFADINVTRILAKEVPGFKGHIVIDSGKYGFIQQDFKAYIYDLPNLPSDWVDPLLTVGKEHAALGKAIKTSSDLANIGQSLKRPENYTTLIFRGGDGKVRAIQNVPNGLLKDTSQATGYLKNRAIEFGSPEIFAYYETPEVNDAIKKLLGNGSLRDAIQKGEKKSWAGMGYGATDRMVFGETTHPAYRVAEESFDDINLLLNAAARTDEAAGLPPTDEYDKIRMQAAKLAYEKLNKKLDLQKRKEERLARQQGEEAARMDPVFRAMQEAIDAGGLHKDSLLAIWDKDTVDELAKKRVGLVRPDGKVALDDLASRYPEFESDDALMSAMLEWEGIAETGKRLASQFQQFYGAMLSNAELEDFHIMLLDEEEKILGKLLPGKKKPSARGIKKVIRENTGQIRIEDLTVSSYEALTAAMKKAEVAARKAFRAGNIEGTLSEKARQKDLAQARKERLQAKEETKKLHDGLIKLLNDKNIPEDYHDRIAALLEDFDLAPRSARWARRVESAREFMERKKAEGEDVQIPESMLARIERYGKVHWRKLTLDQLREIYDQAEMYANLGKLKDKLLANKEARSREDGVQLMLSEIHKNWGIRVPTEEEAASILLDPTLGEKLLEFERGYFTSLIKAETIIRRLDGFKDMGPIWKLIWLPIQESSNAKYRNIEDISKALESLFGAIGDSLTGKKFKLPGVPQFLTQRKVIMAALNSGNEGNLKALQENDAYGWNDAQIETILGKVTPEEWEFAKGIWGLYEKQYSELAKKYKIMTGTTLKKVPGNYFPLVFDRRLSWLMDKHAAEAEEKDFFKTIYTKPSVTTGRVIERTGGTLPPKLDFSVIFQTLADVNHYVTHVEAVRDAQRILYDPRVRAAIEAAPKDIGGPEAYAELVGALQDIAHPRREPISSMERGITYLRNATTVCQLGMKATVIMSQLFGLGPTTYKLGLPTAIKGFLDFYTHPHELMNKIKSLSPEMAARPKHIERDMRDLYEKLGLELSKVGKFSSLVRDASFGLIVMTDMAISYPTWWGAYNKALAEKGYSKALAKENYSEQEAINYADMMVRTSQGSSLIKDLAGIQRGSELKKLLTLYYTFFSAYHNMMSDAWVKFKYRKSTANFVDLFRAWWWVTIVPLVLEEYMRRRRGLTPREFVKGIIQYRLGGYPVIRDMAGAIFGKYDYEFTPAAASLEKMSMAGKENLKLVTPGAEKRPAKAFQYTFESVGYLFKFPTSQMMITAQGFNDLLGGETNDLTRLLFRSPQEEIEGTGWEELFGTPEFPSEEGQMSPLNEEDLFGVAEE